MSFIINLTSREIRSSWKRLIFFFLCIALGVGSVVALRSLIRNVTVAVGSDARALMTADVEISSTSDFSPEDLVKIESIVNSSSIIDDRNEVITTSSVARPADPSSTALQIVELKGIEPPFPLVGTFQLDDGRPFDHSLLGNSGAVVARLLLEDLGVAVGDKIRIGESEFHIRGSFDEEPGGSSGFRLGLRVFVEKRAFDEAGITRNTSRIRRRILYRTTDDPTDMVANLREGLKGTTLTVQSYRETQERLSEQFERTENYLALTGLLILVLGGVGVWNVSRAFVEQKRRSVAVLKCLGGRANRIIAVYLLQILTLGALGSVFGVILAQLTLLFVKSRFAADLPEKMAYSVGFSSAAQGIILGILISMLFSMLPLLQVRNIKPSLLLRDENNLNLRRLDGPRLVFGAVCILGLLAIAAWQAGSFAVGAYFLAGVTLTTLCLYSASLLLTKGLRRFSSFGPFSLRQAINSLYRPGNQTPVILLAVGLGAFVVLSVQALQTNLVREFDFTRNERLPTLFFIDVQGNQIGDLVAMIEERIGEAAETTPTVRARIAYVNGKPIDYSQTEVRRQQGQIGREFAITYRPELDKNESIVAGRWWNDSNPAVPEVSVEESMAERLGLFPGDSITFEVSGRNITARVANIRKLDLRNTRTAFVFVFRPGTLEAAPQSYAATILSRLGPTERQRLQREALERFPNIRVFDVADIVTTVQKLVNNFVLAITFVGGFVILTGVLILIGSVALTKSQRVYENAILKTLGTRRFPLMIMLVVEYAVLGTLAGIIGALFAVSLTLVVSVWVLRVEWAFDPFLYAIGISLTVIVVTVVGTAASFGVLLKKPLSILRSQ